MANTHTTLISLFTEVANAIREKTNSTTPIVADSFPVEIENLRTGFDYVNQDVVSIPDYAFYGCEDLRSVDCYNVTSVGASAFEGCSNLKTVILYDSVTEVGENAFKGCGDVIIYCMFESKPDTWNENWNPDDCKVVWASGAIEIWDISATSEDNVTAKLYNNDIQNDGTYWLFIDGIGNMAGYDIATDNLPPYKNYIDYINLVIINNSVTSIGNNAFYNCTGLTSITIPDSVTSIGGSAFYNCTSLTSITIPDSVTKIDSSAFNETAYYNNTLNWENDVLYIDNHLIQAKSTLSEVYNIKNGVLTIGDWAFNDCTGLTSIVIPNSVTSIGNNAFYNCTGLTSITIPDSVTSIGGSAFYNCTSLTSITIPDSVISIDKFAFYGCTSLTSITIPNSVTSIGNNAFYNCTGLTSITIPDSVTSIGDNAFQNCTSLTSIVIPDSVISIGGSAFYNCTSLTSITIGNGVTSIVGYMFNGCSSLTSITIGNNCVPLNGTFINMQSLTSINVYDDNPTYKSNNGVLYSKNGDTIVAYPRNKSDFNNDILDGVNNIDANAFRNCIHLTSITIPDSVTSIGSYAFYGCSSLTSITYIGTVAQWNAITFYSSWNSNTPDYTIHCTDGDIAKDGTITYHTTT